MPKRGFSLVQPAGTYMTYAAKRRRMRRRKGYSTVARTRGVYARGEMKYFDTERSATAITATADWSTAAAPPNVGTPTTLLCPTVGSAIDQRIGREVKIHKIKIRGTIQTAAQANQTAGDEASFIRLILAQDMQTNAAQATGSQIFTTPTTATAIQACTSFQNLANFGRFRVWKDKNIVLQNPNFGYDGTNLEQQGMIRPFKMNLVFKKPVSVRFNATNGGTIADIVDNSFCVYANTSSTALAPTLNYSARVCYKE